jgi:8-oxo-dGTP diphosphatase
MLSRKKSFLDLMLSVENDYLANLSIDCVIFGYNQKKLKILCTRTHTTEGWLLPGGFIRKDADIDDEAMHILERRTGVKGLYLKQFKTFGHPDRIWSKSKSFPELKTLLGPEFAKLKWINERMISIGYYAFTDYEKVIPDPGLVLYECKWFDINDLPVLMLDHEVILKEAFKTLRLLIHNEPIGINLLPKKFTLGDLQALYETILGKKIDQRNFTKKIMSVGILRKLDEKKNIGGHRAPFLYCFNKRAYYKAVNDGIELAF